jgi:hypothetical protein
MPLAFRQLYFLEGKLLAESPRGLYLNKGDWAKPSSYLFICSYCGEVFAKCPSINKEGKVERWQGWHKICRKCPPVYPIDFECPGSIWLEWDTSFIAAFPTPVLQWELQRHLDFYERQDNE